MQILFDKVDRFLKTPSELPKLIIIYGPTACGKTNLSIELAKHLDTEIIGADSRQIYRGLDIGTGKVTETEKQGIKHHMIDMIDPDQDYSVGEYQKTVLPIIGQLHADKKIPILCGGTGLYLDAIAYHFDLPPMEPDWDYRAQMEELRLQHGNIYLWNLLAARDATYAATIHPNSHHAVIRALEVWDKTGKSKSALRVKKAPLFDTLFLTPYDGDRANLYTRIDLRIEEMFYMGLVEEVRNLLKTYTPVTKWLTTIGYSETIDYLQGHSSLDEAKQKIKQWNRNYAKRQLTWFRKYEPEIGI